MTVELSSPAPRPKLSRAEKARRYLAGSGVAREDSDDELGFDDYPWEWIYGTSNDDGRAEAEDEHELLPTSGNGEFTAETLNQQIRATLPNGAGAAPRPIKPKGPIIGAQMGPFSCQVGDCVLLKAEGTNEAWVGLICEFLEEDEEGQKAANFMWFSTEKEIRNKQKKRADAMENELYITPSWDINPLASINGKANIMSPTAYLSKYPSGRIPRGSRDYGKTFICRRGCNVRTATYTEEFVWDEIFKGTEQDIYDLIQRVQKETKATRKRKAERQGLKRDLDDLVQDDEFMGPSTPKKRRKTTAAGTPKSHQGIRTPQKLQTPTHKRIVIKKPLEFTPLGTRIISPGQLLSSPFQIARTRLHVSSVPDSLPCREQEFSTVYSHLEAAISDGSGSCIYISGTPGTGKTATVREVVSQLNASVLADELDDFVFVEINGMKVTDPHQSYSLLWEALRGDRVSPSHALDLLEREFSTPSPRRVPCVVLMDELDQLVTKNQSVMYNFFNWPGLRHSRLIVLAVANTMDLPERTLSNKISSRLGLTRITFPGYTHEQLIQIIQSRLSGVPGNIVDPDAIQFASRKVAAVSGDARRALDICRRAVEIAEGESQNEDSTPATPSKKGRSSVANGAVERNVKVTISIVKRAINEATTSPMQQYLRSLPLSAKLFLAALLARVRRTGVAETVLGEVLESAKQIGKMADNKEIQEYLLADGYLKADKMTGVKQLHYAPRLLAMGAAAAELMEAGIVSLESRRGERTGKVRLNIGEEEVKSALKDDWDVRGLGFGS